MSDYNQNDNGINPISETSSQTNLRTDPQSERRSGSTVERVSARIGRDIPPLDMECLRPFSNSFRTPNLVHSPIRVASPGFNTLSPSLQSPNMFTNSSSQVYNVFNKFNIDLCTWYLLIYDKTKCLLSLCNLFFKIIHPIPIPNDATQEMVESSGGAHATMMISNNNPPHQPMDVDLPPQKGNRLSSVSSLLPVLVFQILIFIVFNMSNRRWWYSNGTVSWYHISWI